jgi:hypothetical protein
VRDAGGLSIDQKWNLRQDRLPLPFYIPRIEHRFRRTRPLSQRDVAVTTYDILAAGSTSGRKLSTPAELRKHFMISPRARVISLSIEKDNRLENYWRRERSRDYPGQLAALGIQYITTPNYSLPLNVPRTEHLVNIRRSLVSGEKLSLAGLNVIPHLNAMTQMDWDHWCGFLREHPAIHYVALEFQTGLRKKQKAIWHLAQLLNLQEAIGRPLHLVAVAGGRYVRYLTEFFGVTVVDSGPFIRTLNRRRLDNANGRWRVTLTARGEAVDDLLEHNVRTYSRTLANSLANCRQLGAKALSNIASGMAVETVQESQTRSETSQTCFKFVFKPTSPQLSLSETRSVAG